VRVRRAVHLRNLQSRFPALAGAESQEAGQGPNDAGKLVLMDCDG
jgi:hypothetical protein